MVLTGADGGLDLVLLRYGRGGVVARQTKGEATDGRGERRHVARHVVGVLGADWRTLSGEQAVGSREGRRHGPAVVAEPCSRRRTRT